MRNKSVAQESYFSNLLLRPSNQRFPNTSTIRNIKRRYLDIPIVYFVYLVEFLSHRIKSEVWRFFREFVILEYKLKVHEPQVK